MSDILSDVVPDTVPDVYFFQVERLVRLLKHKLIPENANHKEHNFDFILSAPNEELHQFLIDLYGDHLLPATNLAQSTRSKNVSGARIPSRASIRKRNPSILSPRKC